MFKEEEHNPQSNHPIIDTFETLLYTVKGAISMYWGFLSKENSYFIVIKPWKDQELARGYLHRFQNGGDLPKNVSVFLSDDPKILCQCLEDYKYIKPKYARNRKKKS